MKSFFKDLPPYVRGIIIILIILVILFIGWKIYQYFKKKAENKGNTEVVSDAKTELDKAIRSGVNPSFTDSAYQATANTIQKLLDGCEIVSTEMDVILEVIKTVKNTADWNKLIIAFGTRDIADCGTFGLASSNYDLVSLLKDQLDTNQTAYKIPDIGAPSVGYNDAGAFTDSIAILSKYLKTIGINI